MWRVSGRAALTVCLVVGVLFSVIDQVRPDHWNTDLERNLDVRKRHIFSCRQENNNCYGVPRCCGSLQCYWEDGYSPFRAGKCVMCVESGLSCQRDSNCCDGLQCDKMDLLPINGVCKAPRTSGACYRNAQCLYRCKRAYFKGQGYCTKTPDE